MFGRGAGTGRGSNKTRKAPGTGMKARTRMARAANKAGEGLGMKVGRPGAVAPKTKLQKKVAAADRAKARAKAVSAGRPAPKTGAQKAMAQKRRANALKRKQRM